MRVHLIRKETIEEFARKNAQCSPALSEWLTKVKFADWDTPSDIQCLFQTADLLGNHSNRVVFDIGGNKYRMICKYAFGDKEAFNRSYKLIVPENTHFRNASVMNTS